MVGVGVPIPVLDEEIAWHTSVSNKDITCPIVDYGEDYPQANGNVMGEANYADLFAGRAMLNGKEIPATPLSSMSRAREIAGTLKDWIARGQFTLGAAQMNLSAPVPRVNPPSE